MGLLCIRCGLTKDAESFFVNKDWKERQGRDCWCKDCIKKLQTKVLVAEYFQANRRKWTDVIWEEALAKARAMCLSNEIYKKSNDARKQKLVLKVASVQFATVMNKYYVYDAHSEDRPSKPMLEAMELEELNKKSYSRLFNGSFTHRLLQYLEDYYAGLQKDFPKLFDDINGKDYAKKISKASLHYDKTMDRYASGLCLYSEVKDSMTQFDTLCKSANLAACKRTKEDNDKELCIGMLIKNWEQNGISKEDYNKPVTFLQDEIDQLTYELGHTLSTLNFE